MKTKKIRFIFEQILIILFVNYVIVFETDLINKTQWLPSFAFSLAFFHAGTFASLYTTITSKEFTIEKYNLILDFNLVIYLSYLGLLFYHNCQVKTDSLVMNYCFGLYMLINITIFIFETHSSYKKHKASLITNSLK